MTAVSDTDASNATADNVTTRSPSFPFWLGVIQVTALNVVADDGTLLNGAFILTPTAPVYISGWTILEGSATLTVTNGVGSPIYIPTTDTVATSFTYTIEQRLNIPDGTGPVPVTGVSVPHTLGASVDISALL